MRKDRNFPTHFKKKLPDAELIYREHVKGVLLIWQQGISSCCHLSFHRCTSLDFIQQKVDEGQTPWRNCRLLKVLQICDAILQNFSGKRFGFHFVFRKA